MIRRLGGWVDGLPIAAFITLISLLAVFRSGVWFRLIPNEILQENLRSFPTPLPWSESTSYGLWALLKLADAASVEASMQVTAVATACCLAICVGVLGYRFQGNPFRVMVMVVLLGPLTTVMLGNVGRNDMLLLTGSVIVACAIPGQAWPWLTVLGTGLMIVGNPEQALAASSALLIVSMSARLASYRKVAALALVLNTAALVVLQARSISAGTDSRIGIFLHNLKASLELFLSSAPLVLYSGFAALWLLVGYCIARESGRDRWLLGVGVLAIPLVLTATTLDQTRVWVGVSSLVILALAASTIRDSCQSVTSDLQATFLGAAVLAFILMPAIEVTFEGIVRMPLAWVYEQATGRLSLGVMLLLVSSGVHAACWVSSQAW